MKLSADVWLKVLIGGVFAAASVVVLLLIALVRPVDAARPAPALTPDLPLLLTQSALDQRLVLPTYDPQRARALRVAKPTATPRPSPTPQRLAAALAPAPVAGAAPPAVAPPSPTLARPPLAAPVPAIQALAPESQPAESPAAPAERAAAAQPGETSAAEALLAESLVAPDEPVQAAQPGETPAAPDEPASPAETPIAPDQPAAAPTALPPTRAAPPPVQPHDASGFQAYVQAHYNTIGGQPLTIAAVRFVTARGGIAGVTVELAGDNVDGAFAAAGSAASLDYGRRLLDDARFYEAGRAVSINVVRRYNTLDTAACTGNPAWCFISSRRSTDHTWSVTWTYVMGTYVGSTGDVQAWAS